MDARFKDQVAVITGGADGLGKAIAQRIAGEEGSVALFDLHETKLAKAYQEFSDMGYTTSRHVVDVSDEASVEAAFEAVVKTYGRLDIMVNCAGVVGPTSTDVSKVTLTDFEKVMKVNTTGSFLATKHAIRHMLPNHYGRILLVASIAGKEGNAGMTPYSTSKAAVIGLVKAAGKEFAETGITINGLAPAVVKTAMLDDITPEQIKYMTDKIPMKRLGQLEEVAALSAWIVSREAGFNTAFIFDLSGGRATY